MKLNDIIDSRDTTTATKKQLIKLATDGYVDIVRASKPYKRFASRNKDAIREVTVELKDRTLHPSGTFDSAGRWYSDHEEMTSCRTPSRAYPYSEMTHCRTAKWVTLRAFVTGSTTTEAITREV